MKIHFYSDIINLEPIYKDLVQLELEDYERKELISIAETTIHHTVINIILTELDEEDKKTFLQLLDEDDHIGIWEYISKNISGIKERIRKEASLVVQELRKDIHSLVERL